MSIKINKTFNVLRCILVYLYYIPGVTNTLQVNHDNIQSWQVVYHPTERTLVDWNFKYAGFFMWELLIGLLDG